VAQRSRRFEILVLRPPFVATIEKVLNIHFDGLHEGDTGKLGEAFHATREA